MKLNVLFSGAGARVRKLPIQIARIAVALRANCHEVMLYGDALLKNDPDKFHGFFLKLSVLIVFLFSMALFLNSDFIWRMP